MHFISDEPLYLRSDEANVLVSSLVREQQNFLKKVIANNQHDQCGVFLNSCSKGSRI
jgi:hypothetical protein